MANGKPSGALYLLPIFLGLIGALIGWAIVKDKDAQMAKNMWIIGLVVTALGVVLQLL